MAKLSNSDLVKIPGYVLRDQDKETTPSIDQLAAVVRNCYLVISANIIWLLIPIAGILTGNVIQHVFGALIVASAALFLSNNYLGKRWYYNTDFAKGTVYESHFQAIDDIGFRTFFVTMIGSLIFLILAVFLSNAFKAQGATIVLVLDLILSAVLILQALWILKTVLKGLATSSKGEAIA